jgi:glutaminyl-tRNA synthetase
MSGLSEQWPSANSYENVNVVRTRVFNILEVKACDTTSSGVKKKKENSKSSESNEKTTSSSKPVSKNKKSNNFVEEIIIRDLSKGGKWSAKQGIRTRFPPEPNGYLHLGHAKSICLNFGLAKTFGGRCHLRMDDTNPTKEKMEYIDSIKRDVKWLGFDWGEHFYHASDYFEKLYEMALILVKKGLAYVDDQSKEDMEKTKGDVKTPGTNSPYRNRTVEENLKLFEKMKNGDFPDGYCVLRAKIDMAHPQPAMRDPLMYRIRKNAVHPHVGDKWKIYPLYDFAHGLSDAIEGISHSICTCSCSRARIFLFLSLSLSSPHTHTYTHVQRYIGIRCSKTSLRLVCGESWSTEMSSR